MFTEYQFISVNVVILISIRFVFEERIRGIVGNFPKL